MPGALHEATCNLEPAAGLAKRTPRGNAWAVTMDLRHSNTPVVPAQTRDANTGTDQSQVKEQTDVCKRRLLHHVSALLTVSQRPLVEGVMNSCQFVRNERSSAAVILIDQCALAIAALGILKRY
jgi:hypothetical protein